MQIILIKMKRLSIISLVLLIMMPASVFAAKDTFSKRYKNKPVKEVLADLKDATGTRVSYKRKEVNNTRRVTVSFHNATPEEVLNELFDCEYTISKKGKKGNSYVITKRILQQADTLVSSGAVDTVSVAKRVKSQLELPDRGMTLLYREERLLVHYRDSILHTQERIDRPQIEKQVSADETPADKGSSLQFYLGGAYSSMGYKLQDGSNLGHIGGEISVRYAYFFTPEWGLGIGVDFATYGSRGRLNTTLQWDGQADTDGENYNHRAVTHDWKEDQRTYMLSIPLTAQYQHRFNEKVGIFAALGGFVGLPLISNYRLVSGAVEHRGEYPQWGLELYGLNNHDFYVEQIGEAFTKESHPLALKKIAAGVKADLGVIIPMNEKIDLFAGVYGSVVCNDLQTEQHALGWQQARYDDYRKHAFMPAYQGLANSTYTNAIRPWEAGIKIGIHFRPAKKAPKPVMGSGCLIVLDTTYYTKQHADTMVLATVDTIVSLKKTLEKSVIWFNVNDYRHPRLEPADVIEQVAQILRANPSQRVYINGHASEEGNKHTNQILSNRRAETIAAMLKALGVPAKQLVVHGYSADIQYQGTSTTRTQRELNRRVEIIPINE